MDEALIRLLALVSPPLEERYRQHLDEYGELLTTVFLGDAARFAFDTSDPRLLRAVSDLLVVAGPHARNLLLTGFVEGVPVDVADDVVRQLPEPLRAEVARDHGVERLRRTCQADRMTDAVRLTDDELRTMAHLLRRYAETDLDQWEKWRVSTSYGDVFIEMRRAPSTDPSTYHDLTTWTDRS